MTIDNPARVARVRAQTQLGCPTPRPDGVYEPPPLLRASTAGPEVLVVGEDGRRRTFRIGHFPLPGWHPPLADAFAQCTGPQGTLRTITAAAHTWNALNVFLTCLNHMACTPATPSELTTRHLDRYLFERRQTVCNKTAVKQLQSLGTVLRKIGPQHHVSDEIISWLDRRRSKEVVSQPPSGYSDREFEAIMAAARSEVVAIRSRLRNGHRLITTFERDPESLRADELELAATLSDIAATGSVPVILRPRSNYQDLGARRQLAGHLFLDHHDLGPLLTLAVGLSGRNAETIKELSATHEVLEGKAVRMELVKRRRGHSNMFDTVHWEIGTPSQQLKTQGGLYLLLEQMMRLSRSFSGTTSLVVDLARS